MKRQAGFLAAMGLAVLAAMGPAVACTIPLPKMTPEDVEKADVAFVGTVQSIGERGVEVLDRWPELMACQRIIVRDKPLCPADQPVAVAVFEVEEAIHGVAAGEAYVVPQGQGSDCATPYEVGRRYLFGSTGINGQVWVVEDETTAAQAMADWERLPQYFDDPRFKPGEKPWLDFTENAEAAMADETYHGIDPRVLALMVGVLRWEMEAPDALKVSKLELRWYDRAKSEYQPLTDRAAIDWEKPDAWTALTICGTFEVADRPEMERRIFAYTPGNTLVFAQWSEHAGANETVASSGLEAKMIDGMLETWGCLAAKK